MEKVVKRTITIKKKAAIECLTIMFENEAEECDVKIELTANQSIAFAKAYFTDGTTKRCE